MAEIDAKKYPTVLTIAGSDSSGGAGIQADLKTFTSLNVYGMSVITALTAQNTQGVQSILDIPTDFIAQQIESVVDDLPISAVKTGMLSNKETLNTVYQQLQQMNCPNVVVDPVMVSTSGSTLLNEDALDVLKSKLIPISTIVTPNLSEAGVLLGETVQRDIGSMKRAAEEIYRKFSPKFVLVKGGFEVTETQGKNPDDPLTVFDVLYDGKEFYEFLKPYVYTKNTHGSGCSLASAIAAFLAKGYDVVRSVEEAEHYIHGAIYNSLPLGKGHGPLNHGYLITPVECQTRVLYHLKDKCKEEWSKYVNHEFVKKLGDGTLPIQNFLYYLRQDYIFLKNFARANAISMYKSETMEEMKEYARAVSEVILVETELHVKFCERWGISKKELDETSESTFNMAYTRYVLEAGMAGDELDLRVAMAPCIVGYGEIGLRLANLPNLEENPYKEWIKTYSSDWFQSAVKSAIEQLDRLIQLQGSSVLRFEKLVRIFRQATNLEIKFWEMGLNTLP